MQRGSKTYKEL